MRRSFETAGKEHLRREEICNRMEKFRETDVYKRLGMNGKLYDV